MTPETTPGPQAPHLSIDDIRHRAEEIRTLAVTRAKTVAAGESTKAVLVGVVVVVGLMSVAYYLGTRTVRGACPEPLDF
ncbi:MAG: hypothetical protein U1E29_17480 [Coriobacteriia bacterium]|nr:hypothetical protein [Coriobacteriia bacterium]